LLASVFAILHQLGWLKRPATMVFILAFLLVYYPIASQIAQGQLNIVLLALIVLAWGADRNSRPVLAGIAIGTAAAIKLFPAFAVLIFLMQRNWRAIIASGFAFLVWNGLALVVFGWVTFESYIRDVIPSLVRFQSSWENFSLTGLWVRGFDPHPTQQIEPWVASPLAAKTGIWLSRLIVVLLVARSAWRAKIRCERDRVWAAAILGMLLLTPVTWSHSLTLLLLPLAIVAASIRTLGSGIALAALGVFLCQQNGDVTRWLLGDDTFFRLLRGSPPALKPAQATTLMLHGFVLVGLFASLLRRGNPERDCSSELPRSPII
jgi:alpha-1,2-mannosyltransferase